MEKLLTGKTERRGEAAAREENGLKIIRSGRRSFSLEIRMEGLVVRVPQQATEAEIRDFLLRHQDWIKENLAKLEEKRKALEGVERLTGEEIYALADEAAKVIPERVCFYAQKIGVTYGSITIRNQRTRWGSCTGAGNLNFNCLLMLAPPEVLDSVVVHELCHRKEMNHSEKFYAEVLRVFPEYRKWDRWLKENGEALMRRMGYY